MQPGIQATDDSSVMPSGVRSRILRRQCAQRVLCTRGSTERQQQPRNLSVGKGMQGAASGRGGPLLGKQGFKECSNAESCDGVVWPIVMGKSRA